MDSIHGHEVLNMMIESGVQYTHTSLEAAIKARFGEQARFHTCSAEGMTAGGWWRFWQQRQIYSF